METAELMPSIGMGRDEVESANKLPIINLKIKILPTIANNKKNSRRMYLNGACAYYPWQLSNGHTCGIASNVCKKINLFGFGGMKKWPFHQVEGVARAKQSRSIFSLREVFTRCAFVVQCL